MTRSIALIAALTFALPAFAGGPKQVALPVGHSTTLSLGSTVSKVIVEDPSLVQVRREGRRVTFLARSKGATEATVRTAEGDLKLRIYVAEDKYGMPY